MQSVEPLHGPSDDLGRLLDEIAANATPAPSISLIDEWLCKQAPELPFRRANAVLPPAEAGFAPATTAAALNAIEAWYGAADQRVLIQVSSADPAAGELDALLAERGYGIEAPVDLMVGVPAVVTEQARRHQALDADSGPGAAVGSGGAAWVGGAAIAGSVASSDGAARGYPSKRSGQWPGAPGFGVTVDRGSDSEGIQRSGDVQGADARVDDRTTGYRRMLKPLGRRALWASASHGRPEPDASTRVPMGHIGVGFAVAEQGWMGLFGMYTSPQWRGLGVATALVRAIVDHCVANDLADQLYLQVETDNAPAQALYRGLGFTRHHGYHYRVSRPHAPAQRVASGPVSRRRR